jgi:hypothetical protein
VQAPDPLWMAHMLMGNEMQQERRPEYSYGRRNSADTPPPPHMHRFATAPEPLQDTQHLFALAPPQRPQPPPAAEQQASMQDIWEAGCRHGAAEQRLNDRQYPTLEEPPQQLHLPLPFHAAAAAVGRSNPAPQDWQQQEWQQDAGHLKPLSSRPPSGSPGSGLRKLSMESDCTWLAGRSPSVRLSVQRRRMCVSPSTLGFAACSPLTVLFQSKKDSA